MASLFSTTRNTRTLPGCGMRYIRSDVPLTLTADDLRFLREAGVTIAVDLRSDEEAQARPCALRDVPSIDYRHMPVTGGGDTPRSREHLHQVYRGMLDDTMERILRVIEGAEGGVIYFCTAGKDRTGVVSALLLRRMGADDETIIADYLLSGDNLRDMLTDWAATHPEARLDVIMPCRENMERLLAAL